MKGTYEIPTMAAQGSHFLYLVRLCSQQPARCDRAFFLWHAVAGATGFGVVDDLRLRLNGGRARHGATLVAAQRYARWPRAERRAHSRCFAHRTAATPWSLTSRGFCWASRWLFCWAGLLHVL